MRKNVASQVVCAQLIALADGSNVTSGTTNVYVTGDGGTQGAGSGTVTHEGQGCWSYVPTQAETNYNQIAFTFVNSLAASVTVNVYTVAFDPSDTVRAGLTALPNAAAEASGGLFTRGTGAGQINQAANGMVDVNLVRVGNSATPVTNITTVFSTDFATNYNTTLDMWNVNVSYQAGVQTYSEDFTVASATTTTVTLPTTYSNGVSLPDDDRYIFTQFYVVSGTGQGQCPIFTTAGASARQYTLLDNTCPVQLDGTSKLQVIGSIIGNKVLTRGSLVNVLQSGREDVYVGAYAIGNVPLQPTTPGTTLTVDGSGYVTLASTGMNQVVPADPGSTEPTFAGNSTIVQWIALFGAMSVNKWDASASVMHARNTADNANLLTGNVTNDGTTVTIGPFS